MQVVHAEFCTGHHFYVRNPCCTNVLLHFSLSSQSQLPVHTFLQCPYSPCEQSHAVTSACTLKIPSIASHMIVWTRKDIPLTRCTGSGSLTAASLTRCAWMLGLWSVGCLLSSITSPSFRCRSTWTQPQDPCAHIPPFIICMVSTRTNTV